MNGPTNGTNNPAPQRTVNIFESADLERILDAWDDEGVWTPEFVTQVKADIFRALTPAQRDEIGVSSADQLGIGPDGVFRTMLHIGNKAAGTKHLTLANGRISTRTIFPISGESVGRLLAEHTGIQPYHSPVLDNPSLAAEDLFDSAQYKKDFDTIVENLRGPDGVQLARLVDLVYEYSLLHRHDMELTSTPKDQIHLSRDTYQGHPALVTNIPFGHGGDVLWIFNSGSKQ